MLIIRAGSTTGENVDSTTTTTGMTPGDVTITGEEVRIDTGTTAPTTTLPEATMTLGTTAGTPGEITTTATGVTTNRDPTQATSEEARARRDLPPGVVMTDLPLETDIEVIPVAVPTTIVAITMEDRERDPPPGAGTSSPGEMIPDRDAPGTRRPGGERTETGLGIDRREPVPRTGEETGPGTAQGERRDSGPPPGPGTSGQGKVDPHLQA